MRIDAGRDDGAEIRARSIGDALAMLYRRAGERSMRDLPIYNDALDVAALGFRPYERWALGVVVTPWFMNLVLADLGAPDPDDPRPGATMRRSLPSGTIDFTVGEVDGFGRIETCSLFSPMFEFADQAAAVATGEAALAAVLDPAFADGATAAEPTVRPTPAAIDRRRFLRGELTRPWP